MSAQTITRTAFYDLLWTEPLTKLAKQFSVRPADLVRLAAEADLPRPPNGFWAQREFGKAPSRPPMPRTKVGTPEALTIKTFRMPYPTGRSKEARLATPPVSVQQAESTPPTPTEPEVRHKFVRQTARALRGKSPVPPQGLIYRDKTLPSFDLCVCKQSIERALHFLDLLGKGADARGLRLEEVKSEQQTVIAFQASEEHVFFSVTEKVACTEIPPDPKAGRYSRSYTHHATGRLEFQFERVYNVQARWKWADGSTQRIENLLDGILDSVPYIGAEKHRVRLEREEQARYWAEQERIRKNAERQAALEKTRRERLFALVDRWRTAKSLRDFADDAETLVIDDETKKQHTEWVAWIRSIAHEFDPLEDEDGHWRQWAAHVALSQDPNQQTRFWPGHHVWSQL